MHGKVEQESGTESIAQVTAHQHSLTGKVICDMAGERKSSTPGRSCAKPTSPRSSGRCVIA